MEIKKLKIGETRFEQIDVNLLKEAPYDLPERTQDNEIEWLVNSIAENGILQNLRVVEPEGDDGTFEVVYGNRPAKAPKNSDPTWVQERSISTLRNNTQ